MVYMNAVTLKAGLGTVFAEVVSLGLVYLMTSVLGQFVTNGFNPIWYGYFGNLFALSLTVLGSAYAITKIVYAVISLGVTDHGTSWFLTGSKLGNSIHMFEAFHGAMGVMYALSLAIFGYLEANMVWRNFQTMAIQEEEMDMKKGYTYMAMQMIIGITGALAGFLLGDISCGLLGFFDNYNTALEGSNYAGDKTDTIGTSLMWDMLAQMFIIHGGVIVAGAIGY